MIEFWIADLKSDEKVFKVPCSCGVWEFHQRDDYDNVILKKEEGQCAATYYAFNETLGLNSPDTEFSQALGELIDACLILSFLNGQCVTPERCTPQSELQFFQLGDSFIRSRAISGFDPLTLSRSYSEIFSAGMTSMSRLFTERRMRLFLSHWISGLTCFSLEDIFLSIGVQMDIVKQCEIAATGRRLEYYPGMVSASNRYQLQQLSQDYKKMRNDIVHEGRLSGSNYSNKTKSDCADVVASALNWIDSYVCAALNIGIPSASRWNPRIIEAGLPALSFHA